jgi:hypothetical protein
MPAGNGRDRRKRRSLAVLSASKEYLYCENSLLVSGSCINYCYSRVNGDPKYKSYKKAYQQYKPVEELLKPSGVNLSNCGSLEKLEQLQECLSD